MTFEQIVITVGVSLIAIVVPLCILLWIRDYKKNKHKYVRPTDEELFDVEPETVTLPNTAEELAEMIWKNLNEDNKVSLFVRTVPLDGGKPTEIIINKNV